MSKLDKRDQKIKEMLQKDKLISKKADDIFNSFLKEKEEYKMGEENREQKKIKKFPAWKKGLATAACLVVVLGGANIYASTQGYGNVFFLIKYLFTGEKTEITDKNSLLSDRDITISYEPIQLTENIRMQVRRLQIEDTKAKLTVVVREDGEEDGNVVPLKYVVRNSKNEVICDQTSSKEMGMGVAEYQDELQLKSLYEGDKILNLEIYQSNGEKIVKLLIDIDSKTITVEGEEEAISKVSEKDLKEFIGMVTSYPILSDDNGIDTENRIMLAHYMLDNYVQYSDHRVYIEQEKQAAYKVETVNKMLRELGYKEIENFNKDGMFKTVKYQGEEYIITVYGTDAEMENNCLEITNLSYSAGIYRADFKYTFIPENETFDTSIDDLDIHSGTMYFKINDDNEFSRYTVTKFENLDALNYEDNTSTPVSHEDEENETQPTPSPAPTPSPSTVPGKVDDNQKIDNYATSLNWLEYWSPGLWVQYPDTFSATTYSDMYWGSDINYADEKTVEFEGDLKGINPDTKNSITSHTKITVYMPEYVENNITENEYYEMANKTILNKNVDWSSIPGGPAMFTSNAGENWCVGSKKENGKYYELYSYYRPSGDGHGGFGFKILFETNNEDNFKVRNVINWVLGNLRFTSF